VSREYLLGPPALAGRGQRRAGRGVTLNVRAPRQSPGRSVLRSCCRRYRRL